MVFDHIVKHNGNLYEAGQDVPIESVKVKAVEVKTDTAEKPTESLFSFQEEKETKRRGRPKKG